MTPITIKICGITSLEDGRLALDAGADYLGFILYPPSPRYIEPERVGEILEALRKERKTVVGVGVFVNEPLARVEEILEQSGLTYAQLHGGEPPVQLEALGRRGFKAIRPSSLEEATADAEWYAPLSPPEGPQLLIDAYDAHAYGGTGKRADWESAAEMARLYPRLMLAGGLTPDNVERALETVNPWGVDLSSGVEVRPGKKDPEKVRRFVDAVRNYPHRY